VNEYDISPETITSKQIQTHPILKEGRTTHNPNMVSSI
jgi:hypothetical protein